MRLPSAKLKALYRRSAMLIFHCSLFFLLCNLVLSLLFECHDAYFVPQRDKAQLEALRQTHENLTLDQIARIDRETRSRGYAYTPFTEVREKPCRGQFVNVAEQGFRHSKNQGPWPPDAGNLNVFLFGGSTAFGYGLPDDQTIASYLQIQVDQGYPELRCKTYNFGQATFFSTQERILFQNLLMEGFVPDIAIFLDGLNDLVSGDGNPPLTKPLREFVDGCNRPPAWSSDTLHRLPLSRLARAIRRRISGQFHADKAMQPSGDSITRANALLHRYLQNKRLIEAAAETYGVKVLFVWQPVPVYRYDMRHHRFAHLCSGDLDLVPVGYRFMEERWKRAAISEPFLWLADMQETLLEPLYVDSVHYSAKMSRLIAQSIAAALQGEGLLGKKTDL